MRTLQFFKRLFAVLLVLVFSGGLLVVLLDHMKYLLWGDLLNLMHLNSCAEELARTRERMDRFHEIYHPLLESVDEGLAEAVDTLREATRQTGHYEAFLRSLRKRWPSISEERELLALAILQGCQAARRWQAYATLLAEFRSWREVNPEAVKLAEERVRLGPRSPIDQQSALPTIRSALKPSCFPAGEHSAPLIVRSVGQK